MLITFVPKPAHILHFGLHLNRTFYPPIMIYGGSRILYVQLFPHATKTLCVAKCCYRTRLWLLLIADNAYFSAVPFAAVAHVIVSPVEMNIVKNQPFHFGIIDIFFAGFE